MIVRSVCRSPLAGPTQLVEIVTPRANAATITPIENLLAALSLGEPFSLEIAWTDRACRFLVRAGDPTTCRRVEEQLGAAYPQADLRRLPVSADSGCDPAVLRPGEQRAACALVLRDEPYLPLRTFRDLDIAADRSAQADPILGLVAAGGDLPPGWRALSQLVLRPAPDDWARPYLRLAVEHPLERERLAGRADTSLTSVYVLAGLLATGVLGWQGYQWYVAGDWLPLAGLAGGFPTTVGGALWLGRRLGRRRIWDPRLVAEKLSRTAYRAQLRLAVCAPGDVPAAEVDGRLGRLAAAYRQFTLASGNGLVPRRLRADGADLRGLAPLPTGRPVPVLNVRELAGLWHLPQSGALPGVERTTARRHLPLPDWVARGCRIGVSAHQGRDVPVAVPDELLRRHLLLVAKTRRGKSSLLLRLAQYLMTRPRPAPALILVDPHRDLAEAALGVVPPGRHRDVVYLNAAERDRPFGLNLLDIGLGWERDKAVSNALVIFRREFDRFWGARMEDAFRFALLTLFEANRAICAADPRGRDRQFTLLDVSPVLVDPIYRRSVLSLVADPVITYWWSGYLGQLDRKFQLEVINPVQSKTNRYAALTAARAIVGQPRSTVDPRAWLRDGAIVIINTARGVVGEDTAALLGGTLINLAALVVGEQAALPAAERRPVTLLVDECHTMPGADYELLLTELAKYGANLILATQSLTRLEALDREQTRGLRGTVFANLDGLFAFHTSAEDARYLVRELGEDVAEADLVELGEHQCYAKLSVGGERLPVFSVRLDPPPRSDPELRDRLIASSAARYGRDRAAVEAGIRTALARIEQARLTAQGTVGQAGTGLVKDAAENQARGGKQPASGRRGKAAKPKATPDRPASQPAFDELEAVLTVTSDATRQLGDERDESDKGGHP